MNISVHAFAELSAEVAYAVWRLRQEVFVVEQACAYSDLDGRDPDPGARHVVGTDETGAVTGYLRLLDDATRWRIGRVVLAPASRGQGLADDLVSAALAEVRTRDAERPVVLDAQSALAGWYGGFGFEVSGPEFVEDGIPHVPMTLVPS